MSIKCKYCSSSESVKAGKANGKQRYRCNSCRRHYTLHDGREKYSEFERLQAVRLYQRGLSLRSIAEIIGTNNVTVLHWIRAAGERLKKAILSQPIDISDGLDVIEIDEMWHYVKKKRKLWVWLAYSQMKKQIIACKVGSRGAKALKRLWAKIKACQPFAVCTDTWKVYRKVIPAELLIQSKKYTHNVEAQNSSLRDRIKRFNRRTKAYSKAQDMAEYALYLHFFRL